MNRVKEYAEEKCLCETNFSTVHRIRCTNTNRKLVLKKWMHNDRIITTENIENEINIYKDLQRQDTETKQRPKYRWPEMMECGPDWLILEYCDSGDLMSLIEGTEGMELESACYAFRECVLCVNALHEKGYAHMDVSPENFLLDSKGNIKISDFGMTIRDDGQRSLIGRGKWRFLAPECLATTTTSGKAGSRSGQLCDVFSLGVLFFCLLTGSFLFDRPCKSDVSYSLIMDDATASLINRRDINNQLPMNIRQLIERMVCPVTTRFTLKQVMEHSVFTNKHK